MADKRNLTGVWYGRYDGVNSSQTNRFIAQLAEVAGSFSGAISEPDDHGVVDVRHAMVQGTRSGADLAFTKQYDGAGPFAHAVHYAGQVNGDGTEVTGVWTVMGFHGTFVMEREVFTADELEDEEEIELTEGDGIWRRL